MLWHRPELDPHPQGKTQTTRTLRSRSQEPERTNPRAPPHLLYNYHLSEPLTHIPHILHPPQPQAFSCHGPEVGAKAAPSTVDAAHKAAPSASTRTVSWLAWLSQVMPGEPPSPGSAPPRPVPGLGRARAGSGPGPPPKPSKNLCFLKLSEPKS